jgi:4a-hydroxytetrahydrobiopterin dehydratase
MSNQWADRHCLPCEGGIEPMTADAAEAAALTLDPSWTLDPTCRELQREFRFQNFLRTMSFVNAIAHIANVEDHHPDMEVGYDYCRIVYTTHAIGGLSENDFICAAKIDRL